MSKKTQENANYLSQWQLIRIRFLKHKLATVCLFIIVALYIIAGFSEFFSTYPTAMMNINQQYNPPMPVKFSFSEGFYAEKSKRNIDPTSFRKEYTKTDTKIHLTFLGKGRKYKLWGIIPCSRHLFVATNKPEDIETKNEKFFYLFGSDKYGRDVYSRIITGARVSLSIGLIAITISFVLGIVIGGVSGYIGGKTDLIIQRIVEIIGGFPKLPLWMAIAAAMPQDWSPLTVYFSITIVLSLMGWTGLARTVRSKLLQLREEDYAVAASLLGASHSRIIFKHLIPGFTSHIIVTLTMRVPGMILGETSLSFLGLGLRPPVVSWGVMLQDCMNMQAVSLYPWLLLPLIFIVVSVLSLNFLGDGLRDAADPYAAK